MQLISLLRRDADRKLISPWIVYPATGFLFDAVRTVQGRILTLALMYRLSGEKRYFEKARAELLQLADLPEWRPSHFLDTGEASLAAGIGLDWLYEALSPSERDRVAQAIVRNALLPSLEVKEGAGGWVDGDFNWNQVCHAGLVVGALAVAEREPILARKIVERAIRNVPHAEATYAPDGSYPEGPSYWSYGTTFHVFFVEALRSAFGTSWGLGESPGFLKTADFVLQMVGPTGQDYNFSDYHTENRNEPVMLWFARERHSRSVAEAELANIAQMYAGATTPRNQSRHLAFELLWWDSTIAGKKKALPLHWTAGGKLPIAAMRSSWNDPRATFVSVKGGTPTGSHAHMDVGSFILEADGVRWALDLGTESYSVMRAAKIDLWNYTQSSSRWTTFRVGPQGHNLLLFDGQMQDVTGKAEIRELPNGKDFIGNVVALTTLYRGQVAKAERYVRLFADRTVCIEDFWETGNQGVEAAFQWLTQATVTRVPGKNEVLLRQKGETLRLIAEPATAVIEIEDASRPRNAQDSPNPGLTRLVIRLSAPAHTRTTLRVRAIPGSAAVRTKYGANPNFTMGENE